jgi:endoglucanase
MVVSEDAYQGDAKFAIVSDGLQVGGIQTVTASHGNGQWQTITLTVDLGPNGPDNLDFNFLNDAWGGSSSQDRNMYIQSINVNGVDFAGTSATDNADAGKGDLHDANAAVLLINGSVEFHIDYTAPPPHHDTVM